MTMTPPAIRAVSAPADIARVAELIARSFDHLDANRYLIPDRNRRLSGMQVYFTMLAEHAAAGAGQVLIADDFAAAAVWFDRTRATSEPAHYDRRLAQLAGPHATRFTLLDRALAQAHPPQPHWHLAFLAVQTGRQRQGLGGALLNHTHAWLDDNDIPSYLEATNHLNQALYRRYGYTDMNPSRIVVGDPSANTGAGAQGVTFFRMWAPPGRTTRTNTRRRQAIIGAHRPPMLTRRGTTTETQRPSCP